MLRFTITDAAGDKSFVCINADDVSAIQFRPNGLSRENLTNKAVSGGSTIVLRNGQLVSVDQSPQLVQRRRDEYKAAQRQ